MCPPSPASIKVSYCEVLCSKGLEVYSLENDRLAIAINNLCSSNPQY